MAALESRINRSLTDAELAALNAALTAFEALVETFSVPLTKEERKQLLKVDAANSAFIADTVMEMGINPEVFPHYLSREAIENDLNLWRQLSQVEVRIQKLLEMIQDTRVRAIHEALSCSLVGYKFVKAAALAGVQGADTAHATLKKRFHGQGRRPAAKTIKIAQ